MALEVAAGVRARLPVFGDDYPTPDGTCVRDYVHVSDLADAHVVALRRLLERDAAGVYNLGSGRGHSVREVIEVARRITGRPIPFEVAARREGDPAYAVADAALARRELGWEPRCSDLETIIGTAWKWMQSRHGRAARTAT
jgi:UDP-glucose 4-epimerase